MQKEIKKLVELKLYSKDNASEWATLIKEYYESLKETAKGIVLKWRYFEKKNYWRCLRELQKIKFYSEKDNFYKLVNEIINDIAIRASYERLINPYEFKL